MELSWKGACVAQGAESFNTEVLWSLAPLMFTWNKEHPCSWVSQSLSLELNYYGPEPLLRHGHKDIWALIAPNTTYHQEVIEQEDFSLMQSQLLGFIGIRNFKKPAVADQSSMGKREHLCRERHVTMVTCPRGSGWEGIFYHYPQKHSLRCLTSALLQDLNSTCACYTPFPP